MSYEISHLKDTNIPFMLLKKLSGYVNISRMVCYKLWQIFSGANRGILRNILPVCKWPLLSFHILHTAPYREPHIYKSERHTVYTHTQRQLRSDACSKIQQLRQGVISPHVFSPKTITHPPDNTPSSTNTRCGHVTTDWHLCPSAISGLDSAQRAITGFHSDEESSGFRRK